MTKSAMFLIVGIVAVGGTPWVLTRPAPPAPTPDEMRAMAAVEAHRRQKGVWQDGTSLKARPIAPRVVTLGMDGPIATWFVLAEHPGNLVGGHSSYYLDQDFKVVRFVGGK